MILLHVHNLIRYQYAETNGNMKNLHTEFLGEI